MAKDIQNFQYFSKNEQLGGGIYPDRFQNLF